MDRPLYNPFGPIASEADLLMAETLGLLQPPPSFYAEAEARYHTLADWLERDDSEVKGLVTRVYGQGGVAQGSSIASRATNDEFDVDGIVELDPSVDRGPAYVLDTLYRSIRGKPGSRYYDVTTRCTRCVQVQYADKMHVDLTPAVLQAFALPRQSTIFHHRSETPSVPGKRLTANPYGFTEWFKMRTPPEPLFAAVLRRESQALAKADVEPLPEQVEPHGMSRSLAALHLIKRFRNLRYDRRECRCPPSVLLAKLVAEFRATSATLASAVLEHATALRDRFALEVQSGSLISESNPRCPEDVLTDRWPGEMGDQSIWLRDLNHLVNELYRFAYAELSLSERQDILADLFGESVAGTAMLAFAERMGRDKELGRSRYERGNGKLVLPAAATIHSAAHSKPVPRTTYFGGRSWPR